MSSPIITERSHSLTRPEESRQPTDTKSFKLISNLSFMCKVVEKVVFRQITSYLSSNNLCPALQSGFKKFHPTESAILRLLSDIHTQPLTRVSGQIALPALLDVNTAIDTVDHEVRLKRQSLSYGITGTALNWIKSFLVGRTQTVHLGSSGSRGRGLKGAKPLSPKFMPTPSQLEF